MRAKLTLFAIVLVALIFSLLFARQFVLSQGLRRELPVGQFETPRLRVLTYSTFISSTGPGSTLFSEFKKKHSCDVEVVSVQDTGLMLERLVLNPKTQPFDLVIGLDLAALESSAGRLNFKKVNINRFGWSAEVRELGDSTFIPFDWSPLTFIYRRESTDSFVPQSMSELLDARLKNQLGLQDPRISSAGQQFLSWVHATQGEKTLTFLHSLKPNVHSVSPSWALSYGLFERGQVKFIFSYLTSLLFHWGVEGRREFQAVEFAEGHPIQVEFAAIPEDCRHCDLAADLIRQMVSVDGQKLIMTKNFMRPVLGSVEAGTLNEELPHLKGLSLPVQKDFQDWDRVFPR